MTHLRGLSLALLVSLAVLPGCASNTRGPIVPEENQENAEEMYGEQQQSMQSLNETGAEQAAAAHEDATRPVKPPGRDD